MIQTGNTELDGTIVAFQEQISSLSEALALQFGKVAALRTENEALKKEVEELKKASTVSP